tara:strand:+ start:32 stop:604 length:573 start_codon:yes stop_codon:yes gene_type:complete
MALVIKGSSSGQVTIDVPAAAGTNTITLPASTFTVPESGKLDLLHVRDEKGTLVHGGSAGANTDNIRVLNTVKTNEITGASLSSNQITLPAGTYFCEAFANGCMVDHHRAFLYNVTDSSVELIGQQYYATAFSNLGDNTSMIFGRFTISAQKVFELRHRTQSAKADIGLGHYMNDTRNSVYADVLIRKLP